MEKDLLTNKVIKCVRLLEHKTGKKRSQENILSILYQYENISQKELQNILEIESGSLSEILSKLEKNGFIIKYKDDQDKRKFIIQLTDQGNNKILHKKSNDEDMFDMLTIQEKEEFLFLLDKILVAWKQRHEKYHSKK